MPQIIITAVDRRRFVLVLHTTSSVRSRSFGRTDGDGLFNHAALPLPVHVRACACKYAYYASYYDASIAAGVGTRDERPINRALLPK